MSKKQKKQNKKNKESFIKSTKRADGTTEIIVTKSPQNTLWGKIIIVALALLLGGSAILGLIFVLAQL